MGIEREICRQLEKRKSQCNYDAEGDSSRSCSPDDNRKFASSAIAFVIKHSRKGIVPLCASVAELMQDKESLQKEVRELQRKLDAFHEWLQSPPSTSHTPTYVQQSKQRGMEKQMYRVKRSLQPFEVKVHVVQNHPLNDWQESESKENQKNAPEVIRESGEKHVLVPGPLQHCKCSSCIQSGVQDGFVLRTSSCDLHRTLLDRRVLAEGDLLGWIRYVGHIDGSTLHEEVVVGVELDEPVGGNNGFYNGQQYFQCAPFKGIFLPISSVICIQKENVTSPPLSATPCHPCNANKDPTPASY